MSDATEQPRAAGMGDVSDADKMVRYCPECGLALPLSEPPMPNDPTPPASLPDQPGSGNAGVTERSA